MRELLVMVGGVLVLAPLVGQADTPPSATADRSSGQLEEIVVTAQRREQSIQDVPISISAFTATDIRDSGATSARDYLMMSPDVSFADDGQTGNRSLRVSIRGVSNISLNENAVPNAIGYYIDEFNVGTVANGTINPSLLDMQSIEVLRGPQGTYFGRNSTGGAINITTNLPDNKYFAELAANTGNYSTRGGRAIVNVPVSDTFFLRGVVGFESSDGTVRNVNPKGTKNSGYDQTDVRLSARWLATDRLTADLSYTYSNDTEGLDGDINTGVLEEDTISIEGPGFRPISNGIGFYPQNQNRVDHGIPEWNRNGLEELNLRLTYDFGNFTLKSITGDIRTRNSRMFDEDAVSVNTIYRHNEWHAESYGEELRLQSKAGGQFDWIVGALYARDHELAYNLVALGTEFSYTYPDTGVTVGLAPPFPNLPVNQNISGFTDVATGLYAEGTWHASDALSLTLGGRLTQDKISNSASDLVAFGTPQPSIAGSSSFSDFSPRAVASYKLSPEASAYVSISHGYKAGGNDLNGSLVPESRPFQPEKVWNYEVGYKSEFWDHRATLNASVFYLSWKDLQSQAIFLAIPGNIGSAVEITENASTATSKGADIQARLRPTEHLTLGLSAGYLDAAFGSFTNAEVYSVPINMSNQTLPQAPRWTGSGMAEWSQAITDNSSWYARFEEVYRSTSTSNLEGAAYKVLGLPSFPFQMPAFWVSNLSAGVTVGQFRVDGVVNNVFDREYYTGTGDHFGFGGVRVTPHPRMWRLELVYRTH